MTVEGIRSLKQNASAVVARAAAGEVVTVTDRGRPVAQLGPIRDSVVSRLVETGQLRPALHDIRRLLLPEPVEDRPVGDVPVDGGEGVLSREVARMREDERY